MPNIGFLIAILAVVPSARGWAERSCESLVQLALAQASVTTATLVPAGPYASPPVPGLDLKPIELPAYCRVVGVAKPTPDSEIKFELWLPVGSAWNGKYEQVGNGGFAGAIPIPGIAAGVSRGYATAATDDGHIGGTATFAIGHPEKVVDFGWRGVHETSVQSKAITTAFYGRAPVQAYFFGCSDGGREALMEAQRFPADFNGILAGAPANQWTPLVTMGVWNWRALNATPGSMISPAKLAAIQAEVAKQCDAADGVKDGLLEDPRTCHFKAAALACAGPENDGCLTPAHVTALELIYQGPRSPTTGTSIAPGAVPGAEAVAGNWLPWVVPQTATATSLGAFFGISFYSGMVFQDLKWDYHSFDFDRDYQLAVQRLAPILDSNDPSLRAFRDRGGKLIQYHGWGDAAIPGPFSIAYYERVRKAIGKGNDQSVDDFYRLYMVPGMGHCAGGLGPNDFGNLALVAATTADATHNIHTALEQWVEHGVAPAAIIARGVRPGQPAADPAKGVKITRPLCPYPQVARYRGTGSSDEAANFACVRA